MKKTIWTLMVLLAIFCFAYSVSADVIPENSHPLSRCVKFVNLNDFSDVVLVGFYTGPMVDTYEAYKIENDTCLQKGYKFNTLNVYWTTKEKFDSLDLKNLKLNSEKVATGGWDDAGNPMYMDKFSPADLALLLGDIEPYGGYVDDSNPLIKETIEYSIASYSDGKLVISKSRQISEYNDGSPNKIETFEGPLNPSPEPMPQPQPQKKGFWSSIRCFFKRLFGASC